MGEGSWEIAPWGGGGEKREKASKEKQIFKKKRTKERKLNFEWEEEENPIEHYL